MRQKNAEHADVLQDLKLLVEFIDTDLKPTFDLRKEIGDGIATVIEFQDLWHLFQRGDMVIVQANQSHAYRVLNYTGGREPLIEALHPPHLLAPTPTDGVDGFVVDCINIEFDGSSYVPKLNKVSIPAFAGRRPILSLAVYPLKLHPNADRLRSDFRNQGERYLTLTRAGFCHRMMTGKSLDEPPQEFDAQVIIDISMAMNRHPEWRPEPKITERDLTKADKRETTLRSYCGHPQDSEGCCGGDIIHKDLELDQLELGNYLHEHSHYLGPRTQAELDDEDLMMLPHWVYGFVLRSRRWIKLRTSDISDVTFENDFNALLLPEQQKKAIQALVSTHENAKSTIGVVSETLGSAIDIVKGKGAGLILLLHGEPGERHRIYILTRHSLALH